MKIDLNNLDVDVKHTYEPPSTGGSHEGGETERIPAYVSIYSVIANGIEIIAVIPKDYLESMEREILEENYLD